MVCGFALLLIPGNKFILVLIGCFGMAVASFLTGPSQLLGLPNILSLIRAGLIVGGVGSALIQNYAITHVIKSG